MQDSSIKALSQQNFEPGNPSEAVASETEGEEVQGGPKTQEMPIEIVPEKQLLNELDYSPELSECNRKALQRVILSHKNAFGLNGRLGNYNAKVEINLRPGAKEISLPPYKCLSC